MSLKCELATCVMAATNGSYCLMYQMLCEVYGGNKLKCAKDHNAKVGYIDLFCIELYPLIHIPSINRKKVTLI